jgi:RHS repeat-associated protein
MVGGFNQADEFGVESGPAAGRYGWLGGKQRSAEALDGVVLMGVRLYVPDLGRFLQPDPVPGGSASLYDYCSADPVNCFDLDGKWGWSNVAKFWNDHHGQILTGASIALGVLAFTPICPVICGAAAAVVSAVSVGYDIKEGDPVGAVLDAASVVSFGAGSYLKWAAKGAKAAYEAKIGVQGAKSLRHELGRKLGKAVRRVATQEKWDKRLTVAGVGWQGRKIRVGFDRYGFGWTVA